MLRAAYSRYFLAFNAPARTSRATMHVKETYFVKVWDDNDPTRYGIGECAIFRGLGADDTPDYEAVLSSACRYIHAIRVKDIPSSSIRFGFETALADLRGGGHGHLYDTPWSRGDEGITINGLIWMGSADEMTARVGQKINEGFKCLKLKIGGIDWESELAIIASIRERFGSGELELRLDANEAFSPDDALARLRQLAPYDIHSIEQPIRRGQLRELARVVKESPIAIALDEELIGITDDVSKRRLLAHTRPAYIILKPSLCGGLDEADRWIDVAESLGIGWWATSALESDVGLNAISQWVSRRHPSVPQGLGTGQLYRNNIASPLRRRGDQLWLNPDTGWDYSPIGL